jgi:hypothetical protein
MRISVSTCAVLIGQFRQAVRPYECTRVHVVQLGHRRAILWAEATYSWGIPAVCMTTRPWGPRGTQTHNLYYGHADVNCWVLKGEVGVP